MDPLEQIFAQSRLGSASEGPSPQYQAFQDGQQTSLARQRLALEERQVSQQEALMPLRIAQAKQAMELNTLGIQKEWQNRQDLIDNAKAATELSSFVSQSLKNQTPNNPADFNAIRQGMFDIGSRFPNVVGTPIWENVMGSIDKSEVMAERVQMAKDAISARQQEAVFKNQEREDAEKLREDNKKTTEERNVNALIRAEQAIPGAPPPDDPIWKTKTRDLLAEMTAKTGETFSVTNPDGTTTTYTRGKPTQPSAFDNKMTEKEIDSVNTLNAGNALLGMISPKTVGAKAALERAAFDVAGPQLSDLTGNPIFSAFANMDRIEFPIAAAVYRARIIRDLKSDSNIGVKEQQKLDETVPSVGAGDSALTAEAKVRTMLKMAADAQRTRAEKAKRPIPIEFLRPSELQKAIAEKRITREQAKDIIRKSPYVNHKITDRVEEIP